MTEPSAGQTGGVDHRRGARCASCGSTGIAAYCADCGQRTFTRRFEVLPIVASAFGEVLRLERGLLRTAVGLTVRPGDVLRAYIGGATRRWTDPLKYLLVNLAVATLLYSASGMFGWLLEDAAIDDAAFTPAQAYALDAFTRYFNVVLAFAVPVMAATSWLVYRRLRLNFAEHLIVNLYAYGHICLVSVVLLPLFLLGGSAELYYVVYTAAMMGYYTFVLRRFFEVGWVRAVIHGTVIMVVAFVAYGVVGLLLAVGLRLAT